MLKPEDDTDSEKTWLTFVESRCLPTNTGKQRYLCLTYAICIYTANYKKRDILFLTSTLANLYR